MPVNELATTWSKAWVVESPGTGLAWPSAGGQSPTRHRTPGFPTRQRPHPDGLDGDDCTITTMRSANA